MFLHVQIFNKLCVKWNWVETIRVSRYKRWLCYHYFSYYYYMTFFLLNTHFLYFYAHNNLSPLLKIFYPLKIFNPHRFLPPPPLKFLKQNLNHPGSTPNVTESTEKRRNYIKSSKITKV